MGDIETIANALLTGISEGSLWPIAGAVIVAAVYTVRKIFKPLGYFQGDRWGTILPILLSFAGNIANEIIVSQGMPGLGAIEGSLKVAAAAFLIYIVPKKLLSPSDKVKEKCEKCGRLYSPSLRKNGV